MLENRPTSVIQKILKVNDFSKIFSESININNSEISESEKVIDELNNTLESLNKVFNGALSGLENIQKSAELLQDNLDNTSRNITVHIDAEKKISRMVIKLEEIMEKSKRLAGTNFHNNSEIDKIGKNYTMQSQRDIHNNVTSSLNGNDINNEEKQNNSAGSSEFGDNIELF